MKKVKLSQEKENQMLDELGVAFMNKDIKKVLEILEANKNVELN